MTGTTQPTTLATAPSIAIWWWAIGGAIVAGIGLFRFYYKDENRPTTTFERFWLAAAGFALFELLLFVMLASSPLFLLKLLKPEYTQWLEKFPPPILAALMLGGFGIHAHQHGRIIRSWESKAYRVCRTLGYIPEYVVRLGQYLYVILESGPQPPASQYHPIMTTLAGATAINLDAQIQSPDVRRKWLTLWAAVDRLSKWKIHVKLALTNFNEKCLDFNKRLNQMLSSIDLSTINQPGSTGGDKFVEATGEACLLLAQAIVRVETLPHSRRRRLRDLGVTDAIKSNPTDSDWPLIVDLLVMVFLVVLGIVVIPYLISGVEPGKSPAQAVWLILMIGIMYSAAVATALGWVQTVKRPLFRAFISAAGAGVAAAITALLIQAIAYRSFPVSWERFGTRWPWMLIAAATAAILSFQIHLRWSRHSWAINGLIQCGAMILVSMLVCRLLNLFGDTRGFLEWVMVVGQCGLIGFILGAVLPSRFYMRQCMATGGRNILPAPILESLERRLRG